MSSFKQKEMHSTGEVKHIKVLAKDTMDGGRCAIIYENEGKFYVAISTRTDSGWKIETNKSNFGSRLMEELFNALASRHTEATVDFDTVQLDMEKTLVEWMRVNNSRITIKLGNLKLALVYANGDFYWGSISGKEYAASTVTRITDMLDGLGIQTASNRSIRVISSECQDCEGELVYLGSDDAKDDNIYIGDTRNKTTIGDFLVDGNVLVATLTNKDYMRSSMVEGIELGLMKALSPQPGLILIFKVKEPKAEPPKKPEPLRIALPDDFYILNLTSQELEVEGYKVITPKDMGNKYLVGVVIDYRSALYNVALSLELYNEGFDNIYILHPSDGLEQVDVEELSRCDRQGMNRTFDMSRTMDELVGRMRTTLGFNQRERMTRDRGERR